MAFAAPKTDLVLATGGEADTGYDPLLGWSRYGHPLFKSTLLTRDADLAARRVAGNAMEATADRLTWTIPRLARITAAQYSLCNGVHDKLAAPTVRHGLQILAQSRTNA